MIKKTMLYEQTYLESRAAGEKITWKLLSRFSVSETSRRGKHPAKERPFSAIIGPPFPYPLGKKRPDTQGRVVRRPVNANLGLKVRAVFN